MNVKKLAIIGAIALVVIGCVVAAGCTSTTTNTSTVNPTGTTVATNGVVGTWEYDSDVLVQMMKEMALAFGAQESDLNLDEIRAQASQMPSYQFNTDGTGKIIMVSDADSGEAPFTWKSLGNNKISVILDGAETVLVLSPEKGTLKDETGLVALKKKLN